VGDDVALDERADQLVGVATEQGFPVWRAMGTIHRGWVMVKNDNVTRGISLLRSGWAAYRATGTDMWTPYNTALLAKACEIAGQIEEALTLLDDALQIVESTGQRWFAAELNRHKGWLLLEQGRAEAAERLYRKALSIAQEQEAKLWELRAATSLARLRRYEGRRPEARDLLAPVYGWFTEGFWHARSQRSQSAARRTDVSRSASTTKRPEGRAGPTHVAEDRSGNDLPLVGGQPLLPLQQFQHDVLPIVDRSRGGAADDFS
jgi:predicted ATPase